jgi:Na+-transporting NADH:ubiquinone oxidoreductase subunit F
MMAGGLSCQTPVKQDMRIQIPEEVFGVKQWECTVESNDNVATFIKELVLRLPEGESVDFRAGGYVQLECPPHNVNFDNFEIGEEYKGDWERFGFFKYGSASEDTTIRAYSMANYPEEKGIRKVQHSDCDPHLPAAKVFLPASCPAGSLT